MYVTSRITKDIFAGNPGGATFKWSESAAGVNWPNEYPAVNDIAKDKLGLWQKANGSPTASARTHLTRTPTSPC